MSEKYFNWGIIGTGGIANAFSTDIKYLENHRVGAVLSRSIDTAKSFSSDKPNPSAPPSDLWSKIRIIKITAKITFADIKIVSIGVIYRNFLLYQ